MSTKLLVLSIAVSVLFPLLILSSNFRNDSFSLLKKLYNEAGVFRQKQWNNLLDVVGDDPQSLWGYGSCLVLVLTYWTVGGVFTFFDIINKPKSLRQFKIQVGTNEPIPLKNLIKILAVVLFNQIVITIPVAQCMGRIMLWRGSPPVRQLPPFYLTVIQIAICVLIEEVGFYYSHRLLHHKTLYKYIHKTHHKWTAPVSIVALYSNPVEHIFSNLIPPFLGIFILRCHVSTAWLWIGLAIAFTLSEHSGYHMPFFPSAEAHDFHHKTFNNCFGVLGVLDWLHGTDSEFRKTQSFQRHRLLTRFASIRQQYPDKPNKTKTILKLGKPRR